MSEQDFVKRLEIWFPLLSLNDFDRKRIKSLLHEFKGREKVKYIKVVERPDYKSLHVLPTRRDFERIARKAASVNGIPFELLFLGRGNYHPYKQGSAILVQARQNFVREMVGTYPKVTTVELAAYMGYKNHTSILYLLRGKEWAIKQRIKQAI